MVVVTGATRKNDARGGDGACHDVGVKNGDSNNSNNETLCCCGHNVGIDATTTATESAFDDDFSMVGEGGGGGFDASFIKLSPSSLVRKQQEAASCTNVMASTTNTKVANTTPLGSGGGGFWDKYKHLALLEQVANDPLQHHNSPPALCMDCVNRIERSLTADAERLENECEVYRAAMIEEATRRENFLYALQVAAASTLVSTPLSRSTPQQQHTQTQQESYLERAEQAYLQEMQFLQEACAQHEAELRQLQFLYREQVNLSRDLEQAEYAAYEEYNALQLEARAFDYDLEQYYESLAKVEMELSLLQSTRIRLPAMLYDLQVDQQRGLRYPLINQLRLAYRPKGDVGWKEIHAAWALAAQLALAVGNQLQFFTNTHNRRWKIVPLSQCAKLLHFPPQPPPLPNATGKGDHASSVAPTNSNCNTNHPSTSTTATTPTVVVYNLGHPKTVGSQALLAWNALLYEMVHHTVLQLQQAVEDGIPIVTQPPPQTASNNNDIDKSNNNFGLPFEMATARKIGTIHLDLLDVDDDAGWSRAIHCMSCNLLWLSERAADYVLQHVKLLSTRTTSTSNSSQ